MTADGRVTCDYCNQSAELVSGAVIYPHRSDLKSLRFYRCAPCGAWVGCHPGTIRPLGRLADAALRAAKSRVHAAFDPYWKGTKNHTRGKCYARLAQDLGISQEQCHIGMFDVDLCERALAVIRAWGPIPTARYAKEAAHG